jgi:CBS domain-containing protein
MINNESKGPVESRTSKSSSTFTHSQVHTSQILQVKDVMTEPVQTVAPETSLQDCARFMRDLDIGALPVCKNEKLVGILTDRDLVVRFLAFDADLGSKTANDGMSYPVFYCHEEDDLSKVMDLMESQQIRRIPVLDFEDRVTGIVTLGDLAVKTKDCNLSKEILEKVTEPVRGRAV